METQKTADFKQSFAEYLGRPEWNWTWYVTQTFDDRKQVRYPTVVEHSWRYMMHEMARSAMFNYGFCFAEKGKTGRLHWHALVHVKANLFGQPSMDEVWRHMFDRYGRCHIERYIENMRSVEGVDEDYMAPAVTRYLTKYIAKETWQDNTWWDFDGFMGGSKVDSKRVARAIGLKPEGNAQFLDGKGG